VGQEKALLFFSLGHIDLGHLIPLLLTALTGPLALFAAVATDIISAHDAFAVTSHALLAASFSFVTELPAIAVVVGHAVAEARVETVVRLPVRATPP
jgi:sorbitol-specific phosphotransferase system component IIBC